MTSQSQQCQIELSNGEILTVPRGTNLRLALRDHFDFLYNSPMAKVHCRGFGTCGTCAVKVEGEVSPPTKIETWRLNFPPHQDSLDKGLRLACQSQVLGNLKLTKLSGRWGQGHQGSSEPSQE